MINQSKPSSSSIASSSSSSSPPSTLQQGAAAASGTRASASPPRTGRAVVGKILNKSSLAVAGGARSAARTPVAGGHLSFETPDASNAAASRGDVFSNTTSGPAASSDAGNSGRTPPPPPERLRTARRVRAAISGATLLSNDQQLQQTAHSAPEGSIRRLIMNAIGDASKLLPFQAVDGNGDSSTGAGSINSDPKAAAAAAAAASLSGKQMLVSREKIVSVKKAGETASTNVRVSAVERERQRREDEADREEALLSNRKALSEDCAKIAREMGSFWDKCFQSARSLAVPESVQKLLLQQLAMCTSYKKTSEKILDAFSAEINRKNDDYVKELKRQAEEIENLLEKMQCETADLHKTLNTEFVEIENAFTKERSELVATNVSEIEALFAARQQAEKRYLDERANRIENNTGSIDALRVENAEEYNMRKIELETEVQSLEQKLQEMKALYQLNTEKLEYNFQVLKKRDEENSVTVNQQKRRITRMNDILNSLKTKLAKQEKIFNAENGNLQEDYNRISSQYNDLKKKYKHFQRNDDARFTELWNMNEQEIRAVMEKLVLADKVIRERYLGVAWKPAPSRRATSAQPTVTGSNLSLHDQDQDQAQAQAQAQAQGSGSGPTATTPQGTPSKSSLPSGAPMQASLAPIKESLADLASGHSAIIKGHDLNGANCGGDLLNAANGGGAGSESFSSKLQHRPGSSSNGGRKTRPLSSSSSTANTQIHTNLLNTKNPVVHAIMKMLASEAGFLVEEKLSRLLVPLPSHEQHLLRLDTILKAFDIGTTTDLEEFLQIFLRKQFQESAVMLARTLNTASMRLQPDMLINPDEVAAALCSYMRHKKQQATPQKRTGSAAKRKPSIAALHKTQAHSPADLSGLATASFEGPSTPSTLRVRGSLKNGRLIESRSGENENQPAGSAIEAANTAADDASKKQQTNVQHQEQAAAAAAVQAKEEEKKQLRRKWERITHSYLNERRLKSWESIQTAMEDFHKVLTARRDFAVEVEELYGENNEMRRMLKNYLAMESDQKLEVPPSRVIRRKMGEIIAQQNFEEDHPTRTPDRQK